MSKEFIEIINKWVRGFHLFYSFVLGKQEIEGT